MSQDSLLSLTLSKKACEEGEQVRTQEDLIEVDVMTIRRLTIDMEQLESNPRFRNILETTVAKLSRDVEMDTSDMIALRNLAIREYIQSYVSSDDFPHGTPATTGPGSITHVQVEVIHNASSEVSNDGSNSTN